MKKADDTFKCNTRSPAIKRASMHKAIEDVTARYESRMQFPRIGNDPGWDGAGRIPAFLDSLSTEETAALQSGLSEGQHFAARAHLVRERQTPHQIYLLLQGWAYRYQTTRNGQRQITAMFAAGEFCNLGAMYSAGTGCGICMAQSGLVRTVSIHDAVALQQDHAGIAQFFAGALAKENAVMEQWVSRLGHANAVERLAHLLCELAVRTGCSKDAGRCRFGLPIVQCELADMLGLSAVHLNRTMQHLRSENLIASQGRHVAILDIERLRYIGNFDPLYLTGHVKRSHAKAAGASAVGLVDCDLPHARVTSAMESR